MAHRFLPLLLVLLMTAAPAALAQETPPANETPTEGEAEPADPVTIDLVGVQEGSAFYFLKEGETQRNPTLTLPPSTEVTVNFRSQSGVHNFHPEGFPASDFATDGETITYTFTTPASGGLQYWCDPHRGSGMVGRIQIGAADAGGAPAPEAPTSYEMEAHQQGDAYFFTLKGETQRNPTLYVKPGAQITVTLTAVSGVHNIHVDGQPASDFVSPGETITYTFTAPETGSVQYWCDPHKSLGMIGRVQAGAPATGGGGGAGGDAPEVTGPSVDLASLGYADCAGFMIPQSVADGVVGGPTVDDYVKLCREGEQQGGTVRERHIADYVIPATWALIGLGIVGVVYVNRRYKP